MSKKVLIGIDGGGTYTRVAVTDCEGNLLSHVKWNGGASLAKDSNARENVRQAILSALHGAECTPEAVCALTAGIAGYDREEDLAWVGELTKLEGLNCPMIHVNDAVIAHVGALLGELGIIGISGTGSIIFGVNECGMQIRNYDFQHYANTASRHITYNFVYRVLAGDGCDTDNEIINELLAHFQVNNVKELVLRGMSGFEADYQKRTALFGSFAKNVTAAAWKGSPLAQEVCGQAACELAIGIKLVGSCFEADCIKIALIGSVANSGYIKSHIDKLLAQSKNKKYQLFEPVLEPELGAIIMAMHQCGIAVDDKIVENLKNKAR